MRTFSRCWGTCTLSKFSMPCTTAKDILATSLACSSPFLIGSPDTTMYASPIVSTWEDQRNQMCKGFCFDFVYSHPFTFYTYQPCTRRGCRWCCQNACTSHSACSPPFRKNTLAFVIVSLSMHAHASSRILTHVSDSTRSCSSSNTHAEEITMVSDVLMTQQCSSVSTVPQGLWWRDITKE